MLVGNSKFNFKLEIRFPNGNLWKYRLWKFLEIFPCPTSDLSRFRSWNCSSLEAFKEWADYQRSLLRCLSFIYLFFWTLASLFHVMECVQRQQSKHLPFLHHREHNSAPFLWSQNAINTLAALVCRPNLLPQCFAVLLSRVVLPISSFQQKARQGSQC